MAKAARSRALVGKYAFWVRDQTSGLAQAKFQKATGAAMTINQGEYTEGGAQAPMKEATTASFSNLTLEHGVAETAQGGEELVEWVREVIDMLRSTPYGAGVASPGQLRNLSVDHLRRDRTILRTVLMYNCQPANFDPGEGDNTSTDIQIETLELSMEYFDINFGF